MTLVQYAALYVYSVTARVHRGGKESLKRQRFGKKQEAGWKQTLHKYLFVIVSRLGSVTAPPLSRVRASIGECWRPLVCYHLFSLSSCLSLPSLCLPLQPSPWYGSWGRSLLRFSLVRERDVAERKTEGEQTKTRKRERGGNKSGFDRGRSLVTGQEFKGGRKSTRFWDMFPSQSCRDRQMDGQRRRERDRLCLGPAEKGMDAETE